MRDLLERLLRRKSSLKGNADDELGRQVYVLYGVYSGLVGAERMVLEAGRYNALSYLHTDDPRQRLTGLARIVLESENFPVPSEEEVPEVLDRVENHLGDLLARQAVEERLEQKINEYLDEKHQEYVHDLRLQMLAEEEGTVETPQTQEKLRELKKMEATQLTETVLAKVRPRSLDEIIGQERAVEAMMAKFATKYPQHLLLYGPPGVGKTTAARLVLDKAKQYAFTPFAQAAPFVETDGTTLRWDSRDITNPLIGSVHDPIYQGAQRDFADMGVPEPKPGLVTKAHGGVLFIDEIGEMDPMLLNKLLKVLEDKRVYFESSYYNEDDPQVVEYIRRLFKDGAPADFILVGATTRSPEEINPAIRSRCAEVFFEPLAPEHVEEIVRAAAERLEADFNPEIPAHIAEYTGEGRKAVNLLADAYGLAMYRAGTDRNVRVNLTHLRRVAQAARLVPERRRIASAKPVTGRVYGLGVAGYRGAVIEVEAVAFPAKIEGKGKVRFNDTAGSMAKDSVFNALAAVRRVTNKIPEDYDIHVNVVGGGQIDGPSAGTAITCAVVSALTGIPLRQDMALTGEIALNGDIKPVGGIFEKAYGAKQAGMDAMLIPAENRDDIGETHLGMTIRRVHTIDEVLEYMLVKERNHD